MQQALVILFGFGCDAPFKFLFSTQLGVAACSELAEACLPVGRGRTLVLSVMSIQQISEILQFTVCHPAGVYTPDSSESLLIGLRTDAFGMTTIQIVNAFISPAFIQMKK